MSFISPKLVERIQQQCQKYNANVKNARVKNANVKKKQKSHAMHSNYLL